MMNSMFGPRRKVGLATLFVALALMCGWIRSHKNLDIASIQSGDQTVYCLASDLDGLALVKQKELLAETPICTGEPGWIEVASGDRNNLTGVAEFWNVSWRWDQFGFRMGTRTIDTPFHQIEVAVWIIPYAYFVMPLTFLSAFLLLARQRMVAPAKYQYVRVAREQTTLR